MPLPDNVYRWDIFCNVIDNFGDIGVCWRLARQLASEHKIQVRLWVDNLSAFQRICPEIDTRSCSQMVGNIKIARWDTIFPPVTPGSVVVEAFACRLPEPFIEAMAARKPQPVWINLDYLSAEPWVSGCHTLPSPHPHLPLTKYFFFPGFSQKTGGLLRERSLIHDRDSFSSSQNQQREFWKTVGQRPPLAESLIISLFSYDNPSLADLLAIWSHANRPVCCLMPMSKLSPTLETFLGHSIQPGDIVHRDSLEIRALPFIEQHAYDRLLWSSDINFVRGEDSFVRAQWAAKPMVWQIYPQDDKAHVVKLNAFLDLYCSELAETDAKYVRKLFYSWNDGTITSEIWSAWMSKLPALCLHAENWANNLKNQDDLCSSLVNFCRSKL